MKKVLATVLAAVMVLGMFPAMAVADGKVAITEVNLTVETDFAGKTMTVTPASGEEEMYDVSDSIQIIAFDLEKNPIYKYSDGEWKLAAEETAVSEDEVAKDSNIDYFIWSNGGLVAKEGYEFSDSVAVKVNGEDFTEEEYADGVPSRPGFVNNDANNASLFIFCKEKNTVSIGESIITGDIGTNDFAYVMVIPAKTALNEEHHENVLLGGNGIVTADVSKHNTDAVDVFYTVDLGRGNLTNGTYTITTSYGISTDGAEFGDLAESTKYTVFSDGESVNTYVNVTADSDSWDAAPVGRYTAVVVFEFDREEYLSCTCGANLEEYTSLLKIEKIDGEVVYYVMWEHDGEKFGDGGETIPLGDSAIKFVENPVFGDGKEGEYFHKKGSKYIKCTAPEELNVYDEIVFYVTKVDTETHAYCYSVPEGSTYDAQNGGLIINPSSGYGSYTDTESGAAVTLNGTPVNGTGTIRNGDIFVVDLTK